MASELDLSAHARFIKGKVDIPFGASGRLTITGTQYLKTVQNIGITEEAIIVTGLDTLGYCICRNLDPTNFVEIRPGTGVQDMISLRPGGLPAMFYFAAGVTAPFAIADTAACDVEFLIIEI